MSATALESVLRIIYRRRNVDPMSRRLTRSTIAAIRAQGRIPATYGTSCHLENHT